MQGEQDFRIVYDLPNKDYHEAPGVSSTGLKALLRSPAHFRAQRRGQVEQTASQAFGELVHLAVFEYSRFKDLVAVAPNVRRDSKAYKEFESANVGKLIIKEDEAELITGMVEAILAHPLASSLLSGGKPEVSVFAKCPVTGLTRKVRPDYLRDDDLTIDLKTTKDARYSSFQRDFAAYKYALSGAYYLDTVNLVPQIKTKKTQFVILAVEKEPPFGVAIFDIDREALQKGRLQYEQALKIYEECSRTNVWPCYEPVAQTLTLPPWAFDEAV